MASTRQIKSSTQVDQEHEKVTKAMELVAGAKMRRSVERALASRHYALLLGSWCSGFQKAVPCRVTITCTVFRAAASPKRHLLIAFASNRGLCGAYNNNVLRQVLRFVRENREENVDVIVIGKRLVSSVSTFGVKPIMAYEKDDYALDASSVVPLANYAYEAFKSQGVDSVYLCYNHFKSALAQETVTRPLFPFSFEESAFTDVKHMETDRKVEPLRDIEKSQSYIYEPGKRKVLSYLVPRLGEAQLYQALLESNASEHSARMLAMKSATDAAGEMLGDLSLLYNRARQAGITREIAEISAGSAALS